MDAEISLGLAEKRQGGQVSVIAKHRGGAVGLLLRPTPLSAVVISVSLSQGSRLPLALISPQFADWQLLRTQ